MPRSNNPKPEPTITPVDHLPAVRRNPYIPTSQGKGRWQKTIRNFKDSGHRIVMVDVGWMSRSQARSTIAATIKRMGESESVGVTLREGNVYLYRDDL